MPSNRSITASLLAFALVAVSLSACFQSGLEDTAAGESSVAVEQRADALSMVPSDAAIAVVVTDLAAFDANVQASFEAVHPGTGSPWSLTDIVRMELGAGAGLREDGTIMLVLPDPALVVEGASSQMMVFVAVDDYVAFVGADSPAEAAAPASGGAALDELSVFGETWYARPIEGYAVMSPDAERLARFVPADGQGTSVRQGLAAMGEGVLARSDIAALVNVRSLAPVLGAELVEDAQNLAAGLAHTRLGEADVATLIALYTQATEGVLRDAESVTIGGKVGADGVEVAMALNLVPDSPLAGMVRFGGVAAPLLEQLPAGRLSAAFGVDLSGVDTRAVADWLTAGLPSDGELGPLVAAFFDLSAGTTSIAGATYLAEAGLSSPGVAVVRSEAARDLPALLSRLAGLLQGAPVYLPPISTEADTVVTAEAAWDVRWESGAERLAGASVERFVADPRIPESYLELAETSLDSRWLPRTQRGFVATREDLAVVGGGDAEDLAAQVLSGELAGRLAELPEPTALRARAFTADPFAELYVERPRHWHVEVEERPERWEPLAVFGFLGPHEVAAQIVMPVESLR